MGESNKGIIGLLIGGLLYAFVKLGDELVVVSDEILRAFEESLLLRLSINDLGQAIAELELSVETVVLALLAIFLAIAIIDYISTEI